MTTLLRNASGVLLRDAGVFQSIPGGSTAADCLCCGSGCPERTCFTQAVTSYTYAVTLVNEITFWEWNSTTPITKVYRIVTTGWSVFDGSYLLTLDTADCVWKAAAVSHILNYERYYYSPADNCPSGLGTFEDSGTFAAVAGFADPVDPIYPGFRMSFGRTSGVWAVNLDEGTNDLCGPVTLTGQTGFYPGVGTDCTILTHTGSGQANT